MQKYYIPWIIKKRNEKETRRLLSAKRFKGRIYPPYGRIYPVTPDQPIMKREYMYSPLSD